ncbi:MAG: DeoR/GlpR family DNA-binding transcription regulator, partial [Clostridia bacterium]
KVCRVLGGAVLYEKIDERPFLKRYNENIKLKMEIAKTVSTMIEDKDFISLDSGSTNLCLGMNFPKRVVSVLTNSLDIAKELSKHEHVRVFVAGGELREKNMSMTGEGTEQFVRNYRVKKVFLTSEGVGIDYGIMDAHESESRVKRAMMSIANERYLLVDHTKFSVITPICTAPLKELTAIITDSEINPDIVERYTDEGIKIIVSDPLLT